MTDAHLIYGRKLKMDKKHGNCNMRDFQGVAFQVILSLRVSIEDCGEPVLLILRYIYGTIVKYTDVKNGKFIIAYIRSHTF